MKRIEDECVGCSSLGLPCLGSGCPNREVPHYYCDWCKEEYSPDELYIVNNEDVCVDCILNQYSTVESKER